MKPDEAVKLHAANAWLHLRRLLSLPPDPSPEDSQAGRVAIEREMRALLRGVAEVRGGAE